ncbi:MAG TPA: phosphoribosylanthranilate isomerase [Miltoncostaeaceae bacterium]|nr:phosphoribosylanthranilate isomerase [Miltoncostaeaceae bacterium]
MTPDPPRVKVCGLTVPEEAAACAAAGAWAVGVVFFEGSPRRVAPEAAGAILEALPPEVERVGVFVDPDPDEVARIAAGCGLTWVQAHGRVDVAALRAATGLPLIAGFAVDGPEAIDRAAASPADLVMFDAAVPGRHGGTGRSFRWELLERHPLARPFVLAGGLTPANVAEGVRRLGPAVVDVSSGVERSPGRKDPELVRAFIAAVGGGAARPLHAGAR